MTHFSTLAITRYWIPVFFIASVIFYLSSLPQNELPQFDFPLKDKIAHVLVYGALGFTWARAWTRNDASHKSLQRALIGATLFCIVFGITDEWHQSYTPGRDVEFWDVVADGVGGFLGGWISWPYRRWTRRFR